VASASLGLFSKIVAMPIEFVAQHCCTSFLSLVRLHIICFSTIVNFKILVGNFTTPLENFIRLLDILIAMDVNFKPTKGKWQLYNCGSQVLITLQRH
jgi:hypothetical protein